MQSAPQEAPPAYDPGIDYDAMPDYSDYHQPQAQEMYVPQQEWTPKKPGAGGKKWDKKPWDKNGKRGGDRDQPRAPTHAGCRGSPDADRVAHAASITRNWPARSKIAGHFADESNTYTQLLVALIEAVQKNPKLNSIQLMARWHGTEQGRLLKALAEKEWLIDGDNLEQQFFDTITRLISPPTRRETWNNSQESTAKPGLTSRRANQIANQMRDLLSRNVSASSPTSTGA